MKTKIIIEISVYGFEGGHDALDVKASLLNEIDAVNDYFTAQYPDTDVAVRIAPSSKTNVYVGSDDDDEQYALESVIIDELQQFESEHCLEWFVPAAD